MSIWARTTASPKVEAPLAPDPANRPELSVVADQSLTPLAREEEVIETVVFCTDPDLFSPLFYISFNEQTLLISFSTSFPSDVYFRGLLL